MELQTVAVLLALAGFSLLAYALRVLDAGGAAASFAIGLVIALVGGMSWLLLMAVFTGIGVLATRAAFGRKRRRGVAEARGGERGAANVLGNGLAPTLAALTVPLAGGVVPAWVPALAFASAVAAAAADTMASELGVLSPRARSILPPFRRDRPGRNGAVSLRGQMAAVVGAAAIAAAAWGLMDVPLSLAWVPALAGFLGCQVDSLLGATLERGDGREGPLGKQQVNFLAGFLAAAAVYGTAVLVSVAR